MTEDPSSSDNLLGSRRSRLRARRHRIRFVSGLAVLVVAGVSVLGAFAWSDRTNAQPKPIDATPQAKAAPDTGANTDTRAAARPLDHAHPLRLWIGGDSLAGGLGFALGDQAGNTGVIATKIDYKVSSGLSSNDLRNWRERAKEQMVSADPEAVVFIIGANDTMIVNHVDANGDGVHDWIPGYRSKVDEMMDTFVGGAKHRSVFWIGPPTMKASNYDSGAVELGKVMREEAAKRAPDVTYIDAYKLFSGPSGSYSAYLTDAQGNSFLARAGDGVHFTPKGAAYLANSVFGLIDSYWHATAQADTSSPIEWKIVAGSGESVPGIGSNNTPHVTKKTHYGNNNSGNGNNDASATSTPVYVSPTTVLVTPTTVEAVPPPTSPPVTVPETVPVTTPTPTTTA